VTVVELIEKLAAAIAKDPRVATLRVDCEQQEDDSQSLGVLLEDQDPWGEDSFPQDQPMRVVITTTDGLRWQGSKEATDLRRARKLTEMRREMRRLTTSKPARKRKARR
jgi:hypothetical protein